MFNCDASVSIKKQFKSFLVCCIRPLPSHVLNVLFIYIQKILEVLKKCFRMDFLNTTKNYFLAFLDFTTCL